MVQIGDLEAPAPEFVRTQVQHSTGTDLPKDDGRLLRFGECDGTGQGLDIRVPIHFGERGPERGVGAGAVAQAQGIEALAVGG